MKKEFKIICKIPFLPYWAAASFSAQPRKPARPASCLARSPAHRARPASGRSRRVAAERWRRRTGGTPVGPATPRARLHLPTPLRSSSLCQFALSSANASSSRSARSARAIPGVAVLAALVHLSSLHLALNTTSSSRASCSPR